LVELLSRKAAEGVEVRLLLDALGCMLTRGRFVDPLRRAGGQVGVFMPILPLRLRFSTHLRNHRKIIVIDGETAMIGGMNLTHNYIGPDDNPKRWIDTAAVLRGPVVADLENIFESDWNFTTGESIHFDCTVPRPSAVPGRDAHLLQIAASGPDVVGEPLYEALLAGSFEARHRIWMVSPYFVPDEGIFRALTLQARLGHDVRILLPKRSNHGLADIARGRFLRQLVADGARVYLYPHGMIHAKHAVFDENLAMAGSANLDMRSLYLNYEVALFFHSRDEVNAVAQWMEGLMNRSEQVTAQDMPSGFVRQWAEDLSLLVSPLL
jgi:cardiolipin synthase